jgi:hypothetical protein
MNENEIITVVTGLPRSGTSLMMQLLEKIGINPMTDGVRTRDASNPEGYYEYERVKGIFKDNSFLSLCKGKSVKIVTPLPMFLDKKLNYRVLFMRRAMEEILKSQETMLKKDQQAEREKFSTIYSQHLAKTYQFLENSKIAYLDVEHRSLINDSESEIKKILTFLEKDADLTSLINIVKPDLYRNRI